MVCNNCGNQIQEGQQFCTVCGSPVSSASQYNQVNYEQSQNAQQNAYGQPQNGQQNVYGQSQYTQQNAYGQQQYGQQNTYGQPQNTQQNAYQRLMQQNTYAAPVNNTALGMKWFKFVIWFQLFANCVLNIYNGYRISLGKHYNVSDSYLQRIYSVYDGLQTIDITVGVTMMVIGIYAIITRSFLAGFKKQGPFMYYLCLFFNILVAVIYCILVKATVDGVEINLTRMISNAIMMTVLLICNLIYFGKRRHLFVN